MLQGKTVVLGVTGGIAAYKMPQPASPPVKFGGNVQGLMTPNATPIINAGSL